MKTVLAIIAVLGLATIAQAGISVVVDSPVDLDGVYQSTLVHLVADTYEERVTAWDGSFNGPMNQLWLMGGAMPTPTLTNADYLDAVTERPWDTHFMFSDDALLTVSPPSEDGPGTGTFLMGIFGILPDFTAQDLVLAQIVTRIADGPYVVEMTGITANAFGIEYDIHTLLPIPEPTTMGLIVIGGLALLRRRKI
ncbi:MAG: PEP-CTERM sorting domain-containing protein [Phycisphaerae bacterium]|nr:PEP-CTERM sorting domain-containing protein [Phycisphaerae bacterium]